MALPGSTASLGVGGSGRGGAAAPGPATDDRGGVGKGGKESGVGEGGVLVCCLPWSASHPFRDGVPFLLLSIETPPTVGRSLVTLFSMFSINLFRQCCALPVSPAVATIYLLGSRSFYRCFLVYQTGYSIIMHGRSPMGGGGGWSVRGVLMSCMAVVVHMTIDPRIPTVPGRSTSGCRPGAEGGCTHYDAWP